MSCEQSFEDLKGFGQDLSSCHHPTIVKPSSSNGALLFSINPGYLPCACFWWVISTGQKIFLLDRLAEGRSFATMRGASDCKGIGIVTPNFEEAPIEHPGESCNA